MSKKIGVIDSGVGGLTVVKEIFKYIPNEEIVYFGDTERCPYGNREQKEIVLFSWQMIHHLLQFNLKALVIACNTATAFVLDEAREKLDIPVFGVIEPGSKEAIKETKNKRIGVIATTRTVESKSYTKTIKNIDEASLVYEIDTPRLVPMIESEIHTYESQMKIINSSLAPLLEKKVDTLILGCTHYPLIEKQIKKIMGKNVILVHSGKEIAKEIKSLVDERKEKSSPEHLFFASGDTLSFEHIATNWLQREVKVKKVSFATSV